MPLSMREREKLLNPRLKTMPHALFKGLTLSSMDFVFQNEMPARRTAKRLAREGRSAEEITGWQPVGTMHAANQRLLHFVDSYTHGLGRAELSLPPHPQSQFQRNPLYRSAYGREIAEVPYHMQRDIRLPAEKGVVADVVDEDMFEANRQKSQLETQMQLDAYRAQAQAEAHRIRLKEERLQQEKHERRLHHDAQRAIFERSRAEWERARNLRKDELQRNQAENLMQQDQDRFREYRNNEMMKKLKFTVGSMHSHAVWFEDVRRHEFYNQEEQFALKIAEQESKEAQRISNPNDFDDD